MTGSHATGPHRTGPAVFTIPPGVPFADALAAGCLDEAAGDPLALADMTVLLPNRRACRALRDAFLRRSDGAALLLPRLTPLGDLDADELDLADAEGDPLDGGLDLPPALSPVRRQMLLARLILARQGGAPDHAAALAADLARLLDQLQTAGIGLDALQALVPDEHARHWQITLEFLTVLSEGWPQVLAALDATDPAARRNAVLAGQAALWTAQPPDRRIIAAGSTGSVPAAAALMAVIARLPRGAVVLPGLDQSLASAAWEQVRADPSHPQFGLAHLLERLEVAPDAVAIWPGTALVPAGSGPARARLVSLALLPAACTQAWREAAVVPAGALAGVTRIDCPQAVDEAAVIALLLRETLERPEATAALVTPDRDLARRVAAELRRFDIEIDDSAGQPLDRTPVGAFLRLITEQMAATVRPVPLLALLKHPLAAGGQDPAQFRSAVRALDSHVLRGPRPGVALGGLAGAVPAGLPGRAALVAFIGRLDRLLRPLAALADAAAVPIADLLAAHIGVAEALAATDQERGADRLWLGEAGETAAAFVAELADAVADFPPIAAHGYPGLFASLLSGLVVRPRHGRHPRLAIWGPLEARLQRADRLVLGGLNEGTWPAPPTADPWLSRPMRATLGLPAPERRIGLAAHDFAQAFAAGDVILTRAQRVDGTPTVASRWLQRLDAVLAAAELPDALAGDRPWLAWARALDRVDQLRPWGPPAPRPPVAARPRQLSVTDVELWMRDPYALYAKHILRLRPLDPLDADPGAAERGSFIHAALDAFAKAHPGRLPPDAFERLVAAGRDAFGPDLARPAVWAFWWPRFLAIARWFLEREADRRPDLRGLAAEVAGRLALDGPAGPWTLTARADRIDRLGDGSLRLIDYKTGTPPTQTDIRGGWSPQLPLEALIARAGGFAGVDAAPVAVLEHWHLSGGAVPGEIRPVGGDLGALLDATMSGLAELVAAFDQAATAYAAVPRADKAPRFNPYLHLARAREWATEPDGG